jgi:predicted thioredoxin/glutaredoxin
VNGKQVENILYEMHNGICGGHYMAKHISHKILRELFWLKKLFKDAHRLVRACDAW